MSDSSDCEVHLDHLSASMASFDGESTRVIDKFKGENFNLWKFKIEMMLAFMDLWEIVDDTEEPPSFDEDPKVKKEYN